MAAVDTPKFVVVDQPGQPAHADVLVEDSSASATSRLFDSGTLVGKYIIVRLIAKGGMSEVYEALHQDLHKRVALKVLRPELRNSAEAHARFAAEAVNAASVSHTNIVDVIDFGAVYGLPYLVMTLLVGRELAGFYAQHAPVSVPELLDLLVPVGLAVALGHERGILHRDLKPENIFLHEEAGRIVPKLLDFGVSRMLGARRITSKAHVFGTPQYMAPEQARGEKTVGPRADQYALGVILYEGLTGRLPRNAQHPHVLLYSVAFGSFLPPSVHVALPEGLEAVVLRALDRDPSQRYASVHELVSALLPYASPALRAYWTGRQRHGGEPRVGFEPRPMIERVARAAAVSRSTPVLSVDGLIARLWQRPSVVGASLAASLVLTAISLWTVVRCVLQLAEQ